MNLTYPGPVILGLPQFNIDLPEDWRLTDDPDLLMVAGTSEPHNGFRNNVTINGGRAPRPIEPVQIAERSRESGIDGADSVDFSPPTARDGLLPGLAMEVAISVNGMELSQVQHVLVAEPPEDRGVAFWYQLTGTCRGDDTAGRAEIDVCLVSFYAEPAW